MYPQMANELVTQRIREARRQVASARLATAARSARASTGRASTGREEAAKVHTQTPGRTAGHRRWIVKRA
jgi:hypothetical protein